MEQVTLRCGSILSEEDAMPQPYDPQTALLVVDVQNDFAHPEGSLYVQGGHEVVETINGEIAAAREAGATVVYTQDYHPEKTPHFAPQGGIWPVHCVGGTWGAELHADLDVDGALVRKGTGGEDGYSAFSVRDPESGEEDATELDTLLRHEGVERLVVCGLAQDVCVMETALDARRLGYDVAVPLEGTRPVDLTAGDGERAVARMREAGVDVVGGG
jgi:nicotinamidase/pyrazinamidase